MTKTTTMSDRGRYTIDYKARGLTVHANSKVHPRDRPWRPQAERPLAALSLASRARASPRAHSTCTARASGAVRGLAAAAGAK